MTKRGITRRASFAGLATSLVPFVPGIVKGEAATASNVATNLRQLKQAALSSNTMLWEGTPFRWETGNAPYVADEDQPFVSTVESAHEPLSTGAWVRQDAGAIAFAQGAPFVRTRKALDKLRELGASVLDTGAVGDGRADDTMALQEIASHFAKAGGDWRLPPGTYRTTSEIIVDCSKPQRILGSGKRGVYPGKYDGISSGGKAVILPVHSGRSAFRFTGSKTGDGTLQMLDVAVATLETGPMPTAAFGWDTAQGFFRDFSFVDCSVHGFTSAFDLYKSEGSNTQMGLFKAVRCNVSRNGWIARTLDKTQWNGFSFKDSEAGQNGYLPGQGGISVAGHCVEITGNSLEGMRDPIRISGSYRGVDIRSNYFEEVVGRAAIWLENVRGPWEIGPNTFVSIDPGKLRHRVLLTNCGAGRSAIPYRANGLHKTPLCAVGNSGDETDNRTTGSEIDGFLRCDSLDNGQSFLREPDFLTIARQSVDIAARETNPVTGLAMPVEAYVTAGTGAIALTYPIKGSAGEWVAFSWLLKRLPKGPQSDPYLSISVNGNAAPGSKDYMIYNFDTWWQDREWVLITCAVRTEVSMDSLSILFFPFGVNPHPGRVAHFLRPVVYTVDAPEKIIPYIDHVAANSAVAAPLTGDWRQGDRLTNAAPLAAGQGSFMCIGSGTPGTWVFS